MTLRRAGQLLVAIAGCVTGAVELPAASLTVAAASNLQFVIADLERAFRRDHPEINLTWSTAATGTLVAQIRHGAPFDVLLAADLDYPRALIESGHAQEETLTTFAHGVLCLWPAPAAATGENWPESLTHPAIRRIAIAHLETAPFGRVAARLLREAGVWSVVEPRLVIGENVAQTLQFIASGNATLGFVPLSLLHTAAPNRLNEALALPAASKELAHGAVVLRHTPSPAAARTFVAWLETDAARSLFIQHGYVLPGSEWCE